MKTFYELRQNNSGGSFHAPATSLIIEADSVDQANALAERHITLCGDSGTYAEYDTCGCCPCCGHRWNRVSEWDKVEKLQGGDTYFRNPHYALIRADGSLLVGDTPEKDAQLRVYVEEV